MRHRPQPGGGVQLRWQGRDHRGDASHRAGGFLCESWNWTDARGVSVLPPLHMGQLTLKLSAKGYETQKVEINAADLDQPVRVVMHSK